MQILRGVILIIILLLGRPTDMSEGLNKRCCNFLPDSLRSGSLSNVNHTYHRFDRRLYSILPLGILLYPSPNFTGGGGQTCKFGHVFDDARLGAVSKWIKISEIQLQRVTAHDDCSCAGQISRSSIYAPLS